MYKRNKNKGITLIALVITIIVLLILAGISISMLSGNNSILNRAGVARNESVIGQEKEQVSLAYTSALANKLGESVTQTDMQNEIDKLLGDSGKTEADKKTKVTGSSIFTIHFNETDHNYTVNNGTITKVADGDSQPKLKLRYTIKNEQYETSGNNTANGNFLYVTPYIDGVTIKEYEEYITEKLATENKTTLFIDSYNYQNGESYTSIAEIGGDIIDRYYNGDISLASSLTTVEELFQLLCNQYNIGEEYHNSIDEWLIKDQWVGYNNYEEYLASSGGNVQITASGGINSSCEIILGHEVKIATYEYDENTDEEYLIPMPSNKLIVVTASTNDRKKGKFVSPKW